MSAPTLEALRQAYAAKTSAERPLHHDDGLKAVAEMVRESAPQVFGWEGAIATLQAERDAAMAEAADLERRLAAEEQGRAELKEALCREEERRYAAERQVRDMHVALDKAGEAVKAHAERADYWQAKAVAAVAEKEEALSDCDDALAEHNAMVAVAEAEAGRLREALEVERRLHASAREMVGNAQRCAMRSERRAVTAEADASALREALRDAHRGIIEAAGKSGLDAKACLVLADELQEALTPGG